MLDNVSVQHRPFFRLLLTWHWASWRPENNLIKSCFRFWVRYSVFRGKVGVLDYTCSRNTIFIYRTMLIKLFRGCATIQWHYRKLVKRWSKQGMIFADSCPISETEVTLSLLNMFKNKDKEISVKGTTMHPRNCVQNDIKYLCITYSSWNIYMSMYFLNRCFYVCGCFHFFA